ncbi:MAG: amidohydrolase family protein [Armatimonadetes bacterium]|nr:amidohydrolase family protein [Armatimonadota bacterium]
MPIFDVHTDGDLRAAGESARIWQDRGIARGVVFGWTREGGSHISLAQICALAEKFPEFVIPFGYINPGRHDGLREALDAVGRGFRGLKFIFPARPYDDDEYFPIYEAAARARMACLFHTGIVIGTARSEGRYDYLRRWRDSSNYMRPACLDRIARAFPEMTIIGAHLGAGAWYEEAAETMVWNANIY